MANPPDRPRVLAKAYAYITRGTDVLVLTDRVGQLAGVRQVPGGTLEAGESPEEAVLRECFEETGLEVLAIVAKLGYVECPCPVHDDEWQLRHFFHLTADPAPAIDAWDHVEQTPSSGEAPIPIHLAFEPMDGTDLALWGGFGAFLPALSLQLLADASPMSGLNVILSDQPVPESPVLACVLDLAKGTFRYEREAKEPRRLRAVGGANWLAQADHQSRLYRFEYGGRAWRFDSTLRDLPEATTAYIQIVPTDQVLPVFSATYGPNDPGLCLIHFVTGSKVRWYTEGLGVWYGIGPEFALQSVLFQRFDV